MTTRTYSGAATPKLTDEQIKEIFVVVDARFNSITLGALLHGKRN